MQRGLDDCVRLRVYGADTMSVHHEMTDLRVQRPVVRFPSQQHTAADARAHGEVNEWIASPAIAIPSLRRCGGSCALNGMVGAAGIEPATPAV